MSEIYGSNRHCYKGSSSLEVYGRSSVSKVRFFIRTRIPYIGTYVIHLHNSFIRNIGHQKTPTYA